MIKHSIEQAFKRGKEKGWDRIYVAVDVHGTILIPTYENDGKKEFYPYAEEAMQYLTQRKDVILTLYTCTRKEDVEDLIQFFQKHDIEFNYINENPEVRNDALGFYDFKPYFNLFLDDKAGFHPSEWKEVLDLFHQQKDL